MPMISLNRIFKHPNKVCMSYIEHMKFSLQLSSEFAKASTGAFIHAFIPDLLVTHSSDTIKKISDDMEKVGCRNKQKNQY